MTSKHTGQQTKSNPRNDRHELPGGPRRWLEKLEQPPELNGIQNLADPPTTTDQRQGGANMMDAIAQDQQHAKPRAVDIQQTGTIDMHRPARHLA